MILKVPIGSPGHSVDGVWYPAKKGVIKVPDDVGHQLLAHGCKEINPKDPTPEDIAAAEKAMQEAQEQADKEAQEEADRLAAEEAALNKILAYGNKPEG